MATTRRPAPAATSTTAKSRESSAAPNAALDNGLFVPRLDLISLPEAALQGTGPTYEAVFESICGVADDSQPVEQYNGTLGVTTAFVDAHQQPVVQVQWNNSLGSVFTNPGNVSGVRWGTGTMIGPDLMLTCGHLFDADPNGWTIPRQNGSPSPISPQQVATSMHVNFLFQVDASGNQRAEQSFAITQLVEYRLGGLDMALCRIAGNPGDIYGWTAFATANPAVGTMLAIIGHPAGMPKRIEAGPATEVTTTVIRYNDIDTLGGNSGSGILDGASGRLVGVHTNGGCNTAGTGSNSGVAIAAIIAASPTLQSITPSSRTAAAGDVLGTPLALDTHTTLAAADTVGTFRAADTAKALDSIATIRTLDTHTTITAADSPTTLRSADSTTTVRAADTASSLDRFTILAADAGTSLAADNPVGTRFGGDIGTLGAGDDPNGTLVEGAFDPGSIGDPVINPGHLGGIIGGILGQLSAGRLGAAARPFVQAGQHASVEGEQAEAGVAELILAELEAAIAAQAEVIVSLQAVHATLLAAFTGDEG